jgi:hypothetical protein
VRMTRQWPIFAARTRSAQLAGLRFPRSLAEGTGGCRPKTDTHAAAESRRGRGHLPSAEMLLNDGRWVWCLVIGQRKDRHGWWCVGIRYYPNATIGESGGWYLLDRSKIRRQGLSKTRRPTRGMRSSSSTRRDGQAP